MTTTVYRWGISFFALCGLVAMFIILNHLSFPDLAFINNNSDLKTFKTMFISIVLEAFPFILSGVLISAILQIFVSEQTISRLIPKNPLLGILLACIIGIIFPICECGIIPVVRRLILKGMPIYIGVVFILAGPIINPIVFASTFLAFRSNPEMVYTRMGLAFVVASIIGLVIYRFVKKNPLRSAEADRHLTHEHDHSHSHSADLPHEHLQDQSQAKSNKLSATLGHASGEFFEMGKYLVFGALITALIQTFLDRDRLILIGQGEISPQLFMMGFAYILSLCFLNMFSAGSLLTFLVFGPMLDAKGMLMLLAVFKARFVLLLSSLIVVTVLAGSFIFERIFFQ